jgi:hypothetical protein
LQRGGIVRENYRGGKRRREEARLKKQAEKRNKRLNKSKIPPATEAGTQPVETPPQDF